jgi:hypothetical protein
MVHDRLGQQVVETAGIAALGGGVVDLEQGFGFSAADRLMLDGRCGQDARAPGGVVGIERTRPLVVGPSPVMTPSRTTVRAWAAVFRQEILEGSSAEIGSAKLASGADIEGTLLDFFFLASNSMRA